MLENTIQFEDVIAVEDKKVPHLAVSRVYKESQVFWGYRNEKEEEEEERRTKNEERRTKNEERRNKKEKRKRKRSSSFVGIPQ